MPAPKSSAVLALTPSIEFTPLAVRLPLLHPARINTAVAPVTWVHAP